MGGVASDRIPQATQGIRVGFLADTPKQWYQYTKELLVNHSLREEQVEAGKIYMKDQTYEATRGVGWKPGRTL
jgi:hypothetical protein